MAAWMASMSVKSPMAISTPFFRREAASSPSLRTYALTRLPIFNRVSMAMPPVRPVAPLTRISALLMIAEPRRSKPYFCEPAFLPHGATNLAKHSPPGRGAPGAWSPSPWRRPWDHARSERERAEAVGREALAYADGLYNLARYLTRSDSDA